MSTQNRTKLISWAIFAVFIAGLFYPPVGIWTGAVLGAWFIGTQRPVGGFALLAVLNCVLSLAGHWRILLAGSGMAPELERLVLGAIAAAIPFLLYRATLRRLPAFASITILAAASSVVDDFAHRFLAVEFAISSIGAFVVGWFGATVVLLWNREFRNRKRAVLSIAAPMVVFAIALMLLPLSSDQRGAIPNIAWCCVAVVASLGAWAAFSAVPHGKPWSRREQILRLLQGPVSKERLHVEADGRDEVLTSATGEQYQIRDGIAVMLRPEDLAGLNGRYRRLYETIGGTYDDVQRVACALAGIDREAYMRSYLNRLEVNEGDWVLETSIGTGLNLKYLPRDARYVGLDLSSAMLGACQLNLRRWGLEADLLLGNAEYLPFANDSFDVVFHVGGINFFSDRERAIHEMIRVAKPGSRILIADETEEHVKEMYERGPITGGYFKNRAEAVTAPVDLIPGEMEEVELRTLAPVGKNRFYVLTFRKPSQEKLDLPDDGALCAAARMKP